MNTGLNVFHDHGDENHFKNSLLHITLLNKGGFLWRHVASWWSLFETGPAAGRDKAIRQDSFSFVANKPNVVSLPSRGFNNARLLPAVQTTNIKEPATNSL
jgi:hypothetical protein